MGVSVRAVPGLPAVKPPRVERVAPITTSVVTRSPAGLSTLFAMSFVLSAGVAGSLLGSDKSISTTLVAIVVGSLVLGIGTFLTARVAAERSARARVEASEAFIRKPRAERREVVTLLSRFGVALTDDAPLTHALARHPSAWRDFQGRFDKEARAPELANALVGSLSMAAAYAGGGLIVLFMSTVVRLLG